MANEMKLNYQKSIELSRIVKPLPKRCYDNAANLTVYLGKGATYVEGLACPVDLEIPIEHAWVVWQFEILDISWYNDNTEWLHYDTVYHPLRQLEFERMETFNLPLKGFLFDGWLPDEIKQLYSDIVDKCQKYK